MRKDVLLLLSFLAISLACRDDEEPPTGPDTSPSLATTTSAPVYTQVSVGLEHACAVTSDHRLFCWGKNRFGQIGDGSRLDRLIPVAVGGARRFLQVSAGFFSTCAIATDNRAYCWGENGNGELGDGTTEQRLKPALVTGGHLFHRVEAHTEHACAVTYPDNRALCWGGNLAGELGIGKATSFSSKPVAVLTSARFRHVTVGGQFSCGVTTDNRVLCWGYNRYGQVGDGSGGWLKLKPVQVAGTRKYRQVDTGTDHACAVTTAAWAFCWGKGQFGVLGTGSQSSSRVPKAVVGGLSFERVSAGSFNTCGETTVSRPYCWGFNTFGAVGDGTTGNNRLSPAMVAGGLRFRQMSVGSYACGVTAEGRAYCWGVGPLGNGTASSSTTPVPVSDPAGTS